MHGIVEFSKFKQGICNVPYKLQINETICQGSQFPLIIIVFKLERDPKYRSHAYFEPVPHTLHTTRLLI